MKKALKNTKGTKAKLKKVVPAVKQGKSGLVKVLVTKQVLLRSMKVARQGEIIEVDKTYAKLLQEQLGFKIQT